jgi:hypothetical protein
MIIYGWGRRTTKDEGPSRTYVCNNCRNTNRFRLITVKKWFTLFFIPVFPYSSDHVELCPICKQGRKIAKAEMDALKQEALNDQAYVTGAAAPPMAAPPSPPPGPGTNPQIKQ